MSLCFKLEYKNIKIIEQAKSKKAGLGEFYAGKGSFYKGKLLGGEMFT